MRYLMILTLVVVLSFSQTTGVFAHQPFFEDDDISAAAPWVVADPTISTALYATLDSANDVDYFAFDGRQGQRILLSITIPQIPGQERFAPEMALIGPGFLRLALPQRVIVAEGAGAYFLPALEGETTSFFEPFSRTSYWERQEERVSLPADGRYVVAVWHARGETGRYTFVIGDKERIGGDFLFAVKMRSYWTPVKALVSAVVASGFSEKASQNKEDSAAHAHDDSHAHEEAIPSYPDEPHSHDGPLSLAGKPLAAVPYRGCGYDW